MSFERRDSLVNINVRVDITFDENSEARIDIFVAEPAAVLAPVQQPILHYLDGFDEKELNELEAQYGQVRAELNQLIAKHSRIYWLTRINYFIANYGSCALFLPFPIQTGNQGIITVAQLFKSDAQVPGAVGYGIGGPLSFIDVVFFMFLFSARKEAVKSTLWYANKKPFRIELDEAKTFAQQYPWLALRDTAELVFDESILRTYNLNGAVTELIYLPAVISGINFSSPGMILATLITLYFGNEYFRKYTDNDYREGKKFWLNEKNREWLITKIIKEKNISTPIQVWLLGLSTISARAFLYYAIAVTTQQVIGIVWPFGWFPPGWVAASAAVHGGFVRYSPIFNHYRNAEEAIDSILGANYSLEEVSLIKEAYKKDLLKREGLFFLLKQEPVAVLLPIFGAFLGGYLGYGLASQQLAQVMNAIVAEVLFTPIGAILLGRALYNAERDRVVNNQHELELQQPPVVLVATSQASKEEASRGIISAAILLNVSAALVAVTSTIGESETAVGTNATVVTAVITLVAIQMGLGSLLLNHNKLIPTVKDFYNSLPSFNNMRTCFFKPSPSSQQPTQAATPTLS